MIWRILALVLALTTPALAQQDVDSRDYLTALIEDNLSSAGRKITITGFEGALSSQARLDSLTIADDDGIWISLTDVALTWTRSDLLRGRLTVEQLRAGEIHLMRLPKADDAIQAEASSFALPELPVSINIGAILAEKLILDAPVLGTALTARVSAALQLADGQGAGNLLIERLDDTQGTINMVIGYRNADQVLDLDLRVEEQSGGLLARLMQIPDAPALAFTATGNGPLSAFEAQIDLSADKAPRLAGLVRLTGQGGGATGFNADLSGDMAPLFAPKYRDFFGDQVALALNGSYGADGALAIDQLGVSARALALTGSLTLAADGLPDRFDLQGRIASQDTAPILLPLTTDQETRITSAQISANFDRAKGSEWHGAVTVLGLDRPDIQIANLALTAAGHIARAQNARQFDALLDVTAEGIAPTSAALSDALGGVIWGSAALRWREGEGAVLVRDLRLGGDGYGLRANGNIGGLTRGFDLRGAADVTVDDLGRFARLSGQNLRGALRASVAGQGTLLSGAFDLSAKASGQDLGLGIAQLDGILTGASNVALSVVRDTQGITLRDLRVTSTGLQAEAKGQLSAAASQLKAAIDLANLRALDPDYGGAIHADITYDGTMTDGKMALTAVAQGLKIGQEQADKVIGGTSNLTANVTLKDGAPRLDRLALTNPQLTVNATSAPGNLAFDITAMLRDLGVIYPEFPGALTLRGRAAQATNGQNLDLKITGPANINAAVKGLFGTSSDLAIAGTAQAGIANAFLAPRNLSGNLRFDLRLRGALALRGLTGRVSLADGVLADPGLPFLVQQMRLTANLAGGSAAVDGAARMSTGGRATLRGSIGLSAPNRADLTLRFASLNLRNPDLFDTSLGGSMTIKGPLLGGATVAGTVDLGKTEIQVPSSSFTSAARLTGLTHIGDSAAMKTTRIRAYGAPVLAAQTPASYNLDIRVRAPNQVFVRGRGLTAELGGEIQLRGTTLDVRPSGAFNLVQGRFEFLGKRLTLDEVLLQMEDQLIPTIYIRATTESGGVTSIVTIEGPAIDPEIVLSSNPELPQEEVLAQLLFGQDIQNLSAVQGLQLANAIATLAGRGGVNIIGKMRMALRLDDLDLQTDETGQTTLTAGKYTSGITYTELTVAPQGQAEIDLNIAINRRLNVHVGAATDGNVSAGFVIQNNY